MCMEMLLKEKKWKDDNVSFYVFINSELEQKTNKQKNVL